MLHSFHRRKTRAVLIIGTEDCHDVHFLTVTPILSYLKKNSMEWVYSHPSRARYKFLVPDSTLVLSTFSLAASSLVTAATTNSFLPSTRMPPLCTECQKEAVTSAHWSIKHIQEIRIVNYSKLHTCEIAYYLWIVLCCSHAFFCSFFSLKLSKCTT